MQCSSILLSNPGAASNFFDTVAPVVVHTLHLLPSEPGNFIGVSGKKRIILCDTEISSFTIPSLNFSV
jgi:hypothetical protein